MGVTTKPCPFCGGASRMELTRRGGGFQRLVIFVEHEQDCIISDKDEFCYGFIAFNTDSEFGKIALRKLEEDFAHKWNKRA